MIPAPGPAARPEAPSSECPRCNGEGRLQTSWGIANVPEDAEFSPCPDCDGTGKTSREDRAKQGELPERIFLQIRDDEGNLLDASEGDDVTWCVDQINDTDEEYVRAESRESRAAGGEGGDRMEGGDGSEEERAKPVQEQADAAAVERAAKAIYECGTMSDCNVMARAALAAARGGK